MKGHRDQRTYGRFHRRAIDRELPILLSGVGGQSKIYAGGTVGLDCRRQIDRGKRDLTPGAPIEVEQSRLSEDVVMHLLGRASIVEDKRGGGLRADLL